MSKNFIANFPDMMHVLITDLYKYTAAVCKKLPHQQQPVAQICQVRMNSKLPCIAERFDHFRFLRQIFVFSVFYITLINKRLKIGAVFDSIRRIDIGHLHLSCHSFFFKQRIHDNKAVPRNHAVGPVYAVLIEFDGISPAAHSFQRGFKKTHLPFFHIFSNPLNGMYDFVRFDGFMDMDRRYGHVKTHPFCFTGPFQRRVQMRIKLIGFYPLYLLIMLCHSYRRIVGAFLILMRIGFNFP